MKIKKMTIKGNLVNLEYKDDFGKSVKSVFKFKNNKQAVENFNKLAKQYGSKAVTYRSAAAKEEFKAFGQVKKEAFHAPKKWDKDQRRGGGGVEVGKVGAPKINVQPSKKLSPQQKEMFSQGLREVHSP